MPSELAKKILESQMAGLANLDPELVKAVTVDQVRDGMAALAANVRPPEGCAFTAVDAHGVGAEWVTAHGVEVQSQSAILYLHGGGYVAGSLATARAICGTLSEMTGSRVLSLDYRLAPEHPHPAAVEEAVAGYRFARSQGIAPGRLAIGGDSAGGGLTFATLMSLRAAGDTLPAASFAFSPWVDLELTGDSMRLQAKHDGLVIPALAEINADWYVGDTSKANPLVSPLRGDLTGLPPCLIQATDRETLADDAVRMHAALEQAGVDSTLQVYEDLFHVFQGVTFMEESQEALKAVAKFIGHHTAPL